MNSFFKLISFVLIILVFSKCSSIEEFDFHGKWQSLNDEGLLIQIDDENNYTLFKNGKSYLDELEGYGKLKIKINHSEGHWNSFIVEDELQKELTHGRIEIVTKDRIRIYFHKHHQILDLADEFHRADDFSSFHKLLD